jgi:hypothetical protein
MSLQKAWCGRYAFQRYCILILVIEIFKRNIEKVLEVFRDHDLGVCRIKRNNRLVTSKRLFKKLIRAVNTNVN